MVRRAERYERCDRQNNTPRSWPRSPSGGRRLGRTGSVAGLDQFPTLLKPDYQRALKTFEQLVYDAVIFSNASGGISTTNLGIEATKVYTRITLSAMTICSILPENHTNGTELWDFPSVASLARTFIETCHRYLYLSEQDLDPEDAKFRLKLYFFHMNSEKHRLYKEFGAGQEVLADFEKKLPESKAALMASPIYSSLSQYMAEKVRRGNTEMHFTDETIAEKHSLVDGWFKPLYRLLSNQTHGTPFATFSQSNERGRGFENDAEVYYITLTINLLNQYLAIVIVSQATLLSLQHVDPKALKHARQVNK